MSENIWTVQVIDPDRADAGWSAWSEWVDRATAEAERAHAVEEGYVARIVAADSVGGTTQ